MNHKLVGKMLKHLYDANSTFPSEVPEDSRAMTSGLSSNKGKKLIERMKVDWVKQQQREEIDRTNESRLRTRRGVELQSVSGDGTVAKRSRIGVREDIGRGAARYQRRV